MSGDDATLDGLLRRWARERPDDLALACPSNRSVFTHGDPRWLTFQALDAEVERLARGLRAIEPEIGVAIGLHLPNSAEAVIALLAVQRAGHVACLLPLHWDPAEIAWALNYAAVRGVITMTAAGVDGAELFRSSALSAPVLRHILAFGPSIPSGVVALDRDCADLVEDFEGELGEPHADAPAVITWSTGAGDSIPIRRTQSELVAAGQEIAAPADFEPGDLLLSTMLGSSIAGIGSGVAAALAGGVGLILHHPFDRDVLEADLRAHEVSHLVLPGAGLSALLGKQAPAAPALRKIIAVWKEGQTPDPHRPDSGPEIVDVRAFGEIGLVAKARAA
jgi:mycobactin salicyl-AMP ligase